jgi:hypothetical protein
MASPKGLFFNTLFCVALGLGGAATAHAATVTIDISVASDQIGITSYDVNGFRFTAEQGVFSMRKYGGGSGDYFWFGSTDPALGGTGTTPTKVSIERIGGGVFDLVSFKEIADAAGIFTGPNVQKLTSDKGGSIDLYFDVSNPDYSLLLGNTVTSRNPAPSPCWPWAA